MIKWNGNNSMPIYVGSKEIELKAQVVIVKDHPPSQKTCYGRVWLEGIMVIDSTNQFNGTSCTEKCKKFLELILLRWKKELEISEGGKTSV